MTWYLRVKILFRHAEEEREKTLGVKEDLLLSEGEDLEDIPQEEQEVPQEEEEVEEGLVPLGAWVSQGDLVLMLNKEMSKSCLEYLIPIPSLNSKIHPISTC